MKSVDLRRSHHELISHASHDSTLSELAAILRNTFAAPAATADNDRSELTLTTILSRAGIGVMHRDHMRRVLCVNDFFCTLVGRTAAELEQLPMDAFTHPQDVDRSTRLYREKLAAAEPFDIEKRYLRPDGSVVWCAVHVSFLCDAAGVATSTIAVVQDITARRSTEQELRESAQHYRNTVELAPQITWTASPDGAIEEVSFRWADVTGIQPADALGHGWITALHPDDRERTKLAWAVALESHEPLDLEYRLQTSDQGYRWFRARARLRLDDVSAPLRWYGTLEDIDDRKLTEEQLRESEERFRLAAQAAGLGIWDYDAVREQREWSPEFKAMLGLPQDAAAEITTALGLVVAEDRHLLQALLDAVKAGRSDHRFEVTLRIHRANDQQLRWMQTGGWLIQAPSGRLTRVLVTIRDVTEERTAEQRIRRAADFDALTALPNRGKFNNVLEEHVLAARQRQDSFALALLDIDHLKETNDSIGHDAGDLLLQTFANRLQTSLPPGASAARLGGDEFAVLLPVADEGDARVALQAALNAMREPFTHNGQALICQGTAGLAMFPRDGAHAAELLKSADIALYVGKTGERGELALFRPEMRSALQRRASMLAVARTAVREGRIVPHYQPKVDLAEGRITGFEALLRWNDPQRGLQGPHTIQAAFGDHNIAVELSDCMLATICADMRRWLDMGLDFGRIAVNLSPAEFRHDNLVARVLGHLKRFDISPERLELEVTETVFLEGVTEAIAATLSAFHDAGVSIALDDFGTGYASLTHLKTFPVDVIKIDRSFVANLTSGSGDEAIVEAVIGLANRLGMKVVAEGVETQEQADLLAQQGCSHAQGFLFGKGMDSAALERLLGAD